MKTKSHVYHETLNYLIKSKDYIYFAIIIFAFSAYLGYAFPLLLKDIINKIIENIINETENMNILQLGAFIIKNNITTSLTSIIFGVFFGIFSVGLAFINGYLIGFVIEKSVSASGFGVIISLLPHGIFELPAFLISLALGLKLGLFPFSAKEKLRSISAFILSFFIFIIFSSLMTLIFLSKNISSLNDSSLTETPLLSVLLLIFFIASICIGTFVLSKNDKKEFLYRVKNSLKVFVFVVIPLLIIAGVIETLLIWFLKLQGL